MCWNMILAHELFGSPSAAGSGSHCMAVRCSDVIRRRGAEDATCPEYLSIADVSLTHLIICFCLMQGNPVMVQLVHIVLQYLISSPCTAVTDTFSHKLLLLFPPCSALRIPRAVHTVTTRVSDSFISRALPTPPGRFRSKPVASYFVKSLPVTSHSITLTAWAAPTHHGEERWSCPRSRAQTHVRPSAEAPSRCGLVS